MTRLPARPRGCITATLLLIAGSAAPDGNTPARASGPPAATTVQRDAQGRISRIEGPGYSVSRELPAPESTATSAAEASVPRPTRRQVQSPVVCKRGQLLELTDVELVAEGAGVIALAGCQLKLSAVEVRVGGWALIAEAGSRVRVDASVLEGKTGSVDAAPGASVSAWSTVFRGPPGRALRAPDFIDRGGNAWD